MARTREKGACFVAQLSLCLYFSLPVSSFAEALRRLEETCSVSNASDSKSEQQRLFRHQQRFIARALEAAEQLQVQSAQAEEVRRTSKDRRVIAEVLREGTGRVGPWTICISI